ncbi:MAG: hypothetical protein OEZ23_06485, partial [Gammaproteobacteria bacterium]|nr:hypothetical protein [Gammaproteobacteria bacterium]
MHSHKQFNWAFPILLITVSFWTNPSLAWDSNRHELICALAEQKFTPEAKNWVSGMMRTGKDLDSGLPYTTFAASCTW